MPTFNEFTFESEPDYDVTPEDLVNTFPGEGEDDYIDLNDFVEAELARSDEEPDDPGAGDSYQGTDPTAFTEQGGTIDEQQATAPDAQTLGEQDDPEAQEAAGDEAEGDDEDDSSDPAQVDSGRAVDPTEEVRFPEQGQDLDELTYKSPESIQPSDEESVFVRDPELFEIAQELLDYQATLNDEIRNELFDWFIEQRESALLSKLDAFLDQAELDLEFLLDVDENIRSTLQDYEFASELPEMDGEDNDDLGDLFTSPSLLIDFGDIIGGVDQDTYLTEFNMINQDDV